MPETPTCTPNSSPVTPLYPMQQYGKKEFSWSPEKTKKELRVSFKVFPVPADGMGI
jgi:hypothetical protein